MGLYGNNIESISENNLIVSMEVFNTELSQEFVVTEGVDIKEKIKNLIQKAKTLIGKFFKFIRDKIKSIINSIRKKNKEEVAAKKEEPKRLEDKGAGEEKEEPKEDKTYHLYYPYVNNIFQYNHDGGFIADTIKYVHDGIVDICFNYNIMGMADNEQKRKELLNKIKENSSNFKNAFKNVIEQYKNTVSEKVAKDIEEFPYKASYTEDDSNYGFKEGDFKVSEVKKYEDLYDKVQDKLINALASLETWAPGKEPEYDITSTLDNLQSKLNSASKDSNNIEILAPFFNAPIQAIMFALGELKKIYTQKVFPYMADLNKFSGDIIHKKYQNTEWTGHCIDAKYSA